MRKLSTQPQRPLTDRECCSLIGSLIGGLLQHTDEDTVRAAVRWWAETNEAWRGLAAFRNQAQNQLSTIAIAKMGLNRHD